jgi:hypothetical protein
MRKFILSILKFILILGLTYPIIVWVWGLVVPAKFNKNIDTEKGSYSFSDRRFNELRNFGDVDLLILGSSHAFIEIDPRFFENVGIKSFNLGSSAQTPIQTEILLKRYFKKLKPNFVVMDVFPRMFTMDGIESSMDLVRNDSVGFDYLCHAVASRNIKFLNTTLFHYLNNGFDSKYNNKYKVDNEYVSGGFVEEKLKRIKSFKLSENQWEFIESQFEALDRIIGFLKSKSVTVLLVESPYTKTLYASYTNHDDFIERLNSKVEYINYNGQLPLEDTLHFNDQDHLNSDGVRIYNRLLVSDVVRKMKHN